MEDQKRLTEALRDRYLIEHEIGSGGMATVYLAQDLKHDRQVAVKVLKPELAETLGAERFRQGAFVLSDGLPASHISNVRRPDIGDDGKTLFVSSKQGDKLTALDTKTGKVVHEISLVPAPYHLNTIHGTGKVYVSSRKEPKIWVVDQKTLKVTGEIALPGGEGLQMAIVR